MSVQVTARAEPFWSVEEATHPLSLERLRAMAAAFRRAPYDFVATEPSPTPNVVLRIADEIEKIARISEESSMQKFVRLRGLAASTEALAPRALDDPFGPLRARLQSHSAEQQFDGLYEGTHSRELARGGEETLNASMLLDRRGKLVNGRFSFGLGEGTLGGKVAGNVLTYEWEFGNVRGRGKLKLDPSGALNGEWGYEDSYKGGGRWGLEQASASY